MAASELVRQTSRFLNKFLFGGRIASDPDVGWQWGTVIISYMLNLFIVFVVVAAVFAAAGRYHPIDAPLAAAALQTPLAIANVATFALTAIASLSWRINDEAINRQRAANRSRGEYLVLLSLFSIIALFFVSVLFVIFDVAALIVSACVNSALI